MCSQTTEKNIAKFRPILSFEPGICVLPHRDAHTVCRSSQILLARSLCVTGSLLKGRTTRSESDNFLPKNFFDGKWQICF